MSWLGSVRVVAITDRTKMIDAAVLATRDWPRIAAAFGEAVARVAARFGDAVLVQVREKDLDGGALQLLVRAALATGARVIVNDRVDVALAAGAHGVHLPERGLSIADARGVVVRAQTAGARLPDDADRTRSAIDLVRAHSADPRNVVNTPGDIVRAHPADDVDRPRSADDLVRVHSTDPRARFVIGVSCHSIDEVARASAAGADLVQLGPIWETPGKPTPLGAEALSEARRVTPAYLVAIGGIDDSRVDLCRQHGADSVAAIRAVWSGALKPR